MQNHDHHKAHIKTIRLAALNLLARREHSYHELKQKLAAENRNEADIEATLTVLQQEGLQSDRRFSENYVRYRAQKGFGPVKISYELVSKGISNDLIEQCTADYQSTWPAILKQVINNKIGNSSLINLASQVKNKLRLERFLQQRGFTADLIRQALTELRSE